MGKDFARSHVGDQVVTFYIAARQKAWKPVVKVHGHLKMRKRSWAILKNGKMYLLGATAFFSVAAAERSRFARLKKLIRDSRFFRVEKSLIDQLIKECREYELNGRFSSTE